MPDDDAFPLPPTAPPATISLVEEMIDIWRLHWEDDPRRPRVYPAGRYRFDAPAGEYPVTYGNTDRLATFAEVYGDRKQILADQATRKLSLIVAGRPLRLVTLDDAEVFHALGVDNRINTTRPYDRTQQWSLALHIWYPAADGIRFVGRNAGNQFHNYCLFLDRCAADLVVWCEGELQDLREVVLAAARRYRLACEVVWRA